MIVPMGFNESTTIILNGNEEILTSCGKSLLPWIVFHVCYTCMITFYILFPPITILILIGDDLLPWWFRYNQMQNEDFSWLEQDHSKLAKLCRFALGEIRLLCIYVSAAFLFTILMDDRSIQLITICRWLIEASLLPSTFLLIVAVYFLDENQCLLDLYEKPVLQLVYMIKGTLFVWMRYVEQHPSSKLNDYQTVYFYCFCNKFKLHQVPDHHLLRRFIDKYEISIIS